VRANGRVFELIEATRQRRTRCDLYHSALVVQLDGVRSTIELAPALASDGTTRGVVATGPVGSRWLGRLRRFRYEVRCWPGGEIPDLAYATGEARRLSDDPQTAMRLLELVASVPTPVWGRDEMKAGEMWNSNSVIAWLICTAGASMDRVGLPLGGRAPGWHAGLAAARSDGVGEQVGGGESSTEWRDSRAGGSPDGE
jgi:hypothetical protein